MIGIINIICILGILFGQMCLVYCSCLERRQTNGTISDTYTVQGRNWYEKCWTIDNSDNNLLFIQLNSLNLGDRPSTDGVLFITLKPENKVVYYWSKSLMGNFTTTSPIVEILFKLNSAKFNNFQQTSFSLSFRQECGGVFTKPTGILKSPYYPANYPALAECIYEIRTSPGNIINITFNNMVIEDALLCRYDYLKIQDGEEKNSSVIALFCGNDVPKPVISTNNYLRLRFSTDGHTEEQGFYATYTVVENEHSKCSLEDNFYCSNTTCVPKSEVCDGIKNCENGADEFGCELLPIRVAVLIAAAELLLATVDKRLPRVPTCFLLV
ncbi:membrane frizzled-related protein-like [Parasteatoda tepidariorum]|uniref:membrane frizzled-related protein-like n=1 Tax=Parasteatoda tepidariorum TaxID=114398 RepID=UPI001C72014F|nr:tolloid-like protein 1 [Parasteatoda tepidariorum]